MNVLPDGSAFTVVSFPLPEDHWLFAPACEEWDANRDESADTPIPVLPGSFREAVRTAARYAIRASTLRGSEMDFDPDAMVQNFMYALIGSCVKSEAMTPFILECVAAYYHDGPYRDGHIMERLHNDAESMLRAREVQS